MRGAGGGGYSLGGGRRSVARRVKRAHSTDDMSSREKFRLNANRLIGVSMAKSFGAQINRVEGEPAHNYDVCVYTTPVYISLRCFLPKSYNRFNPNMPPPAGRPKHMHRFNYFVDAVDMFIKSWYGFPNSRHRTRS